MGRSSGPAEPPDPLNFARCPPHRHPPLWKPAAPPAPLPGLVLQEGRPGRAFPQAGSLAFLTLFSLVPLLAAFSFFGARFLQQPQLIATLAALLPYQEARIAEVLRQFVEAAGSLSGLGFGTFLVTVFSGFNSVEAVINRIWDVPKRRSWYNRITSFLLVLLVGPILIAFVYWAVNYLEGSPRWHTIAATGVVQILPFLFSVLGLTFLNWQVPNTHVRFESAMVGAGVSALLLEILRLGFGIYVESATDISVVYGSFGIAIFSSSRSRRPG